MKKFIVLLSLTISLSAMASADFSCSGTEPFWNVTIKGDTVAFDGYDDSIKMDTIISRESAAGVAEDNALLIKTATSISSIVAGSCNDGMSDKEYTYTILHETDGRVLLGCCDQLTK